MACCAQASAGRLTARPCPDDLYVIAALFAVRTDLPNEVQPDVLVVRFDELTDTDLPTAPVMAVELLSPSGRQIDLNLKRAAYERMGAPSYWYSIPRCPTCWSSSSTSPRPVRGGGRRRGVRGAVAVCGAGRARGATRTLRPR